MVWFITAVAAVLVVFLFLADYARRETLPGSAPMRARGRVPGAPGGRMPGPSASP